MTRILTIIGLLFATPAWADIASAGRCEGSNITGDEKACVGAARTTSGKYFGMLSRSLPNGFGVLETSSSKLMGHWNDGNLEGWFLLQGKEPAMYFQKSGVWVYKVIAADGKQKVYERKKNGKAKRLSKKRGEEALRATNFKPEAEQIKTSANVLQKISTNISNNQKLAEYKKTCIAFGNEVKADGRYSDGLKSCMQDLYLKDKELASANEIEKIKANTAAKKSAAEVKQKSKSINLGAINSYLDIEQRRIDALNQGIRNNAPITCTTSPPMGGYVNTTCR